MSLLVARRALSRIACALLVVLAAFALPSIARAAEGSGDSEDGLKEVLITDCTLHQPDCTWNGSYISTVDGLYAFASATGSSSPYDAVLYRNEVGGEWTVMIAATTTPRGCDEYTSLGIPASVLDDLSITGLVGSSTKPVDCGAPAPTPKDCGNFKHHRSVFAVSAVRLPCGKARSVIISAATHPGKPPKGWVVMAQSGCTGYLVPKKYSGIQFPLAELPTSQPIIFVDIPIACAFDDGAAPPANNAPAHVVPGIVEVPVGSTPATT